MKKIIIVLVVVVILLGVIFFINKPGPVIQEAINDSTKNAVQSSLKAFVANTMIELIKHDSDTKNSTKYDKDLKVKESLDAKLSLLQDSNPGEYSYRIFNFDNGASIKASESSRDIYVCVDTNSPKVIDISASDFNKSTDCSGQLLK